MRTRRCAAIAVMVAGLQLFAAAAAHAVPGWHLRNSHSQGPADVYFTYGYSGDFQHAGDWNGDGRDTPASYRQNERKWYLRDSNSCCVADTAFTYGNGDPGSYTVMGDWNGDGIDTPGIVRNENGTMHWYLRNSNTEGVSDVDLYYGYHGDQYYVAGDWNGDGIDTPGIVKRDFNCWCFQWHLKNSHFGGWADVIFTWAGPVSGDTTTPIVGDWNGDNIDTPGIHRSGTYKFSLRNANSDGWSDIVYTYGQVGDKPLVGDWNGDGVDTVAVIRDSEPQYPTTLQYGGGDGSIATDEEIAAVLEAMKAANDGGQALWNGMHPDDQARVSDRMQAQPTGDELDEESSFSPSDSEGQVATAAGAQCKSVKYSRRKRDLGLFTMYRIWFYAEWCSSGGQVRRIYTTTPTCRVYSAYVLMFDCGTKTVVRNANCYGGSPERCAWTFDVEIVQRWGGKVIGRHHYCLTTQVRGDGRHYRHGSCNLQEWSGGNYGGRYIP